MEARPAEGGQNLAIEAVGVQGNASASASADGPMPVTTVAKRVEYGRAAICRTDVTGDRAWTAAE